MTNSTAAQEAQANDARDEAEADAEARTHFESGNLHFDRGAYEEAQLEFQAAFELSGRPGLLYNLFLTSERLAEYDQAVLYLERYLSEGAPDEDRRATLEPRLENLRARARQSGEAEDPAGAPATPTPSGDDGNMLPAIVAFAVAGAGLVTFAVAGGLALKEDSALTSSCGTACSDEQVSALGTRTLIADIGWITAVAAAAAGTVLALTLGRPSSSTETTVGSWVHPNGGGLVAQGSF